MSFLKASTVVCASVFFALSLSGCGGGGSNGPSAPTTISSTQVNEAAVTLAQSLSANLQAANVNICSNAFQDNYFCSAPIAVTSLCTPSGKSTATGSITDSWDYYASGNATANLTIMPASCAIAGTSLTLTGNPSLSATGRVSYSYSSLLGAAVTETGDISYGTSPAGSCPVNLVVTTVYAHGTNTASCNVTGTLCGQTISQSC